jgi:hypothetical protein
VFRALLREGLSWQLHHRAGTVCGGSSWVRLHLNQRPLGIFIRIEEYDKSYLRRQLGEDDGFLYRFDYKTPGNVERLTREDEPDPYAPSLCFPPFGSGCEAPGSGLAALLGRHVDLEQLLTLAAVGGILANWDLPLMNDNNYFWYNSAPRRRLYFPWDLDLAMTEESLERDVHRDPGLKNSIWQTLLLADPALLARFDGTIGRLLSGPLSRESLDLLLDELSGALAGPVDADRDNGLGVAFADELAAARSWLHRRLEIVRAQVPAAAPFPIVINEIVAENRGGARDEAGELEDWIELFNRGEAPVELKGLFLSDRPAIPALWPLPDRVLGPKERAVIWCDGQTTQGPWHSSFRLDALEGESVGLYEVSTGDYRVRDFVRLRPQAPDLALARVPDGAPSLRALSCPSPGAANPGSCSQPPRFLRGDCNGDGATQGVADAIGLLLANFVGGAELPCRAACDANADGEIHGVADAVTLLAANFTGSFRLPPPHPECGESSLETDAALSCGASPCAR